MDIKEIRGQSADRLDQMASDLRAKIRDLRFTVGTRQRSNVRDLRKAKKELAQVLTLRKAS